MGAPDTRSVNPTDGGSDKVARMLTPDPMRPYSLYDPELDPRKDPEIEESEAETSRR